MEAKMRREMQIELGMRPIEQPTVNPELHMPIYYGNIMERILPVRYKEICFTTRNSKHGGEFGCNFKMKII